jgi:two-component system cell cycle response regulator CtrA
VVNLDTKTVEVNGRRVHLTGKEYQMLELLSLCKGTTLTKEMFSIISTVAWTSRS